jgi:hypothetical protein
MYTPMSAKVEGSKSNVIVQHYNTVNLHKHGTAVFYQTPVTLQHRLAYSPKTADSQTAKRALR